MDSTKVVCLLSLRTPSSIIISRRVCVLPWLINGEPAVQTTAVLYEDSTALFEASFQYYLWMVSIEKIVRCVYCFAILCFRTLLMFCKKLKLCYSRYYTMCETCPCFWIKFWKFCCSCENMSMETAADAYYSKCALDEPWDSRLSLSLIADHRKVLTNERGLCACWWIVDWPVSVWEAVYYSTTIVTWFPVQAESSRDPSNKE